MNEHPPLADVQDIGSQNSVDQDVELDPESCFLALVGISICHRIIGFTRILPMTRTIANYPGDHTTNREGCGQHFVDFEVGLNYEFNWATLTSELR